jgi:uncharacterized membrane protein
MPRFRTLIAAAAVTAVASLGLALPAHAAPPTSYKNCAALNKVYPHGVGKKGAQDHTSSERSNYRVSNYRVSDAVYSYNDGKARHKGEKDLDRDNDGIACEKK